MGKKLIITAALCGVGTRKDMTPHVPITPAEIAADAVACAKAGASIIHFHVRDENGVNTMDTDRFCEVINLTREECAKAGVDIVFNLTTSGSKFSVDLRVAHLPILKPEMCSYDPGSMNWANSYVFLNTPEFLERLGDVTQELEIKPELEIFDAGMIGNVNHYLKKGKLKTPMHYQFVLGVTGGMPGNIESLAYLKPKMQPGCTWSATGIGRSHIPTMLAALAEDCDGLRVGLEDCIYFDKDNTQLATNVQMVERAVKLGETVGRTIATAAEAREILSLKKHI